MTIHVVTHPTCLAHDAGPGHPERPDRLRAVLAALEAPAWADRIEWHRAEPADHHALSRLHPEPYLERLRSTSERGGGRLDSDTVMNASSWEAALRAAGAVIGAARLARSGTGHAFAAVRPPGHHAEAERAMGFCFLGNVALAAHEALTWPDVHRVLIVDWDVHHGNGTQALVERTDEIRFISLHEWPLYPGTGAEHERGVGNVWNLPRPAGQAPDVYVNALTAAIDEATVGWSPDLVFVSAGFDSMAGDPLGHFTLRAEDYVTLTERLLEFRVPIVGALEGGYDLSNLVDGTSAFLTALL